MKLNDQNAQQTVLATVVEYKSVADFSGCSDLITMEGVKPKETFKKVQPKRCLRLRLHNWSVYKKIIRRSLLISLTSELT